MSHPKATIACSLLFCLIFISGLIDLQFGASPRAFMGENHPLMQRLVALENEYTEDNNILVVFKVDEGTVFTKETLRAIKSFTDSAWQLPYIQRVDSITNFQYSRAEEDELFVDDLVVSPESLTPEELQHIEEFSGHEPRLVGYLLGKDYQTTAVNLLFNIDLEDLKAIKGLESSLNQLVSETLQQHPHLSAYKSGFVSIALGWRSAMLKDATYLFTGAIILIFSGLLVLSRSITLSLITMLIAVLAVSSSAGVVGLFRMEIQAPVAAGLLMILTLSLADAIHIIKSTRVFLADGMQKNTAILESLLFNIKPILITSITTAIGFLSFLLSKTHAIRVMGGYAAFGVMLACLLSLTLLPALMSYCSIKPSRNSLNDNKQSYLMRQVIIFRWYIILVTIPAILISTSVILSTKFDDNIIEYIKKSEPFRLDQAIIERNLTGSMDIILGLSSGEEQGVTNPAFMHQVSAFTDWLRGQPEVRFVNVYTDMLKQLNHNMHGDEPETYRLPERRDLAAQYLLLYEISLPYGLDLTNQINLDKSGTRIVININSISTAQQIELSERIKFWLEDKAPAINALAASGSSFTTTLITRETFYSMLESAILALVIIGIILLFTFRSFIPGLLCVSMVVVPIIVTFGAWSLVAGHYDMSTAVTLCMVIGIVVDNAVHFISKFLYGLKTQGYSRVESIHYAYNSVSSALSNNAVVLCLGFGLLLFSAFKSNSNMGALTTMSIIITLISTFTLLPALLSLGKNDRSKNSLSL